MKKKNPTTSTFSNSSLWDDALPLPELKTLDLVTGFFLTCEVKGWLLKSFMNGGGAGHKLPGSTSSDLLANALVMLAKGEQADARCSGDREKRELLPFGLNRSLVPEEIMQTERLGKRLGSRASWDGGTASMWHRSGLSSGDILLSGGWESLESSSESFIGVFLEKRFQVRHEINLLPYWWNNVTQSISSWPIPALSLTTARTVMLWSIHTATHKTKYVYNGKLVQNSAFRHCPSY